MKLFEKEDYYLTEYSNDHIYLNNIFAYKIADTKEKVVKTNRVLGRPLAAL